jgi:two-component system LytT family response regulator
MIRAMVVDDEPLARETLRLLLSEDPEVEVVGEASGLAAAELILKTRPDLLFLDVHMPEVDGFELLRLIGPNRVPAVIFVTAFDQYALKAFEVHALDYLLKPFDDVRFADTLRRAKERLRGSGDPLTGALRDLLASRERVQRFLVRVRDKVVCVQTSDIDWVEAADDYVSIHAGGKAYLLRETMGDVEKRLDPAQFFRTHRSAIVNVRRVREIHPLFRGDAVVVLADGTQVKLSRTRREEFELALVGGAATPP